MNLYIIVEGKRSEKIVYPCWIKQINSKLTEVKNIDQLSKNNFILYSAEGTGNYEEMLNNAIEDLKNYPCIDYLVISIDSEDLSVDERLAQIKEYINRKIDLNKVRIIIQHFCLETWALGNNKAFKHHPNNPKLCSYYSFFNVISSDPEIMPIFSGYRTKADFAYDYLKLALKEKYSQLSYTKKNPKIISKPHYFKDIRKRLIRTNHIQSFQLFLDAFKEN